MSENKKKQVIFHVVNSNSKKCHNTEFSMQLAYYYENEKQEKAYIIDLDWNNADYWTKKDYIPNYEENDEIPPYYINELMLDFKNKSKEEYIHKLKDKTITKNKEINACIPNPKKPNVLLNNVEHDLFESTIYNIINELTAKNISATEKIHFILDMPTENESYSDRIINHLLLDQSSPLYKKFNFGNYKNFAIYKVKLYMLTDPFNLKVSNNNTKYLYNLIRKSSYSSIINELNKENKLFIFFIIKLSLYKHYPTQWITLKRFLAKTVIPSISQKTGLVNIELLKYYNSSVHKKNLPKNLKNNIQYNTFNELINYLSEKDNKKED